MLASIVRFVSSCWRAAADYGNDAQSDLLSAQDIGRHGYGEFSSASLQANQLNEDCFQVEASPPFGGVFIGIYDGHGGPEASRFIQDRLFPHLTRFASEMGGMSETVIRMAVDATEKEFEAVVVDAWPTNPQLASVGSCCLLGVICDGRIYIANLGDSRAVLGSVYKSTGAATALQLTTEHNVAIEAIREELKALHPDDPHVVLLRHGVWRVKGIIQVSRSIGDMYLKKQEFNREPLYARFRVTEPLLRPVLSAEPTILVHDLQPNDRFLIFASDGLWEHLSNEEAVDIVNNNPHRGVARKLIKAALQEAAKKREVRYADLKKIQRGVRRHFHDDITVIVVFVDQELMRRSMGTGAIMPLSMMDGHTIAKGQHALDGWDRNDNHDILESRSNWNFALN